MIHDLDDANEPIQDMQANGTQPTYPRNSSTLQSNTSINSYLTTPAVRRVVLKSRELVLDVVLRFRELVLDVALRSKEPVLDVRSMKSPQAAP